MEKLWVRFNWLLALVGGSVLALMMIIALAEICARHIFNHPLVGVTEILTLLLPVSVFLPLAYVEIADAHIRVDLVVGRLSRKWQDATELLSAILGAALFGIIAWLGWDYAISSWQRSEVFTGLLDLPVYPTRFAIALGFTLATVQLIIKLLRQVGKLTRFPDQN